MDNQPLILVAEDIDSNFILVSAILKKDYRIMRASNGAEVIRLFEENHPDIVLMDMKMPILGGIHATQAIRELDSEVPIIALTAFAFDSDRDVAIQAGCTDYLTKPIMAKTLRETLEKHLNK